MSFRSPPSRPHFARGRDGNRTRETRNQGARNPGPEPDSIEGHDMSAGNPVETPVGSGIGWNRFKQIVPPIGGSQFRCHLPAVTFMREDSVA